MKSSKAIGFAVSVAALSFALNAKASTEEQRTASEFRNVLQSTLGWQANDPRWSLTHLIPNEELSQAIEANSIENAVAIAKNVKLAQVAKIQPETGRAVDADAALKNNPVTVVIVPGVFGEFIPTRAFEEVFAQSSKFRDEFHQKVQDALAQKRAEAQDETFQLKTGKETRELDKLVHVGSIRSKSGEEISRAILFYTPLASLESLGHFEDRASLFTRRLEKYLALTGPQKLLFVGYSRGTIISLEMLAQAKKNNASWLNQVTGMVSLGGVVSGSALADATVAEGSPQADAIKVVRELLNNLKPVGPNESLMRVMASNSMAYAEFAKKLAPILPRMEKSKTLASDKELRGKPIDPKADAKSVINLVLSMSDQMGLKNPFNYSANIIRFKTLIENVLAGADELRSGRRADWWSKNTLPEGPTYYSVTAAMANPEESEYDRAAFDGPVGYSKRSADDLSLLQNRLDYQTGSGISMNDSQVGVIQEAFLPNAYNLKTKFLGVMGTHHWGLALRVVNAMKDGRQNPFPREALLKAIAAQAAIDDSQGK